MMVVLTDGEGIMYLKMTLWCVQFVIVVVVAAGKWIFGFGFSVVAVG